MNVNWIVNQIFNINLPTIIVSVLGSWGVRELIDWLKSRNLQAQFADMQESLQLQKSEIDRQLEITKSECQREVQTHYLQTQLKTASLYKTYPELHGVLKETEGSVYELFYHSKGNQVKTHTIWCQLTQKLAEHSLFLDDSLRDACIIAKDLMMDGIRSYQTIDKVTKGELMASIHEKVSVVTNLMRARLSEGGVISAEANVLIDEPAAL